MKFKLQWIGIILITSVFSTFMMHSYVYYNHERMRSSRHQLQHQELIPENIAMMLRESNDVFPKQTIILPVREDGKKDSVSRSTDTTEPKQLCQHFSSQLVGPLKINSSYQPPEDEVILSGGEHLIEGCYQPPKCISRQKVAFVIPYKNRYRHLLTLLHHTHPILQRQNIMYCVFVAEQYDEGTFNKARIMNAVFKEITEKWATHEDEKGRPFDCFVFHDVDMLLEDDRNLYLCSNMPKHLSPAIDKFNYTTGYGTQYGGVTAMKTKHYIRVNGHSNRFWGWGGEDNDMEERINKTKLSIVSANVTIGRYKMIPHEHPWWFSPLSGVGSSYRKETESRNRVHDESKKLTDVDVDSSGLTDIKYKMMGVEKHKQWCKLTLDIRSHQVENATIHFANYKGPDRSVYSMTTLRTRKNDDESVVPKKKKPDDDEDVLKCIPTYYLFEKMTINRTAAADDTRYTKIYHSLDAAKAACTEMEMACHAIVEQMKERYSLRSTALVQENKLRYKYGLATQYNITEQHHSSGTYVKMCPGDPRYTQFFTEPVIIAGNAQRGPAPRFHVDFYLRVFHNSNNTFNYRSQLMTTHRAIMDEKLRRKTIPRPWWDSLGKIQCSKSTLVTLSDVSLYKAFMAEQSPTSMLLKIRAPISGLLRVPGCYVVRNTILDKDTNNVILEWKWWFQLRASTKEIEEEMLEITFKQSEEAGKEFNEMLDNKRQVLAKWNEHRKMRGIPNRGSNLSNKKN